jgi:hypothetical protein
MLMKNPSKGISTALVFMVVLVAAGVATRAYLLKQRDRELLESIESEVGVKLPGHYSIRAKYPFMEFPTSGIVKLHARPDTLLARLKFLRLEGHESEIHWLRTYHFDKDRFAMKEDLRGFIFARFAGSKSSYEFAYEERTNTLWFVVFSL